MEAAIKLPESRYAYFKITALRFLKSKLFIVVIFFLGLAIGLFLHKLNILKEKPKENFQLKRLYAAGGHLVNPLLGIDNPQGGDAKLEGIKYSVEEYIRRRQEKGDVSSVAMYIKDLNTGTWAGINEDENFATASLIKVPLLIAYLKMAEDDPGLLGKQIKYEREYNLIPQNIAPEKLPQLGNTYTIDQLLRFMIVYSDNISTELLADNIDLKLLSKVYSDLRLITPELGESENRISAKGYSAFFRVLYNATYLNAESSEKALKLLSESEFREGIVDGVPENITVAHKFAERKYESKVFLPETAQLHDGGIVYYPQRPYVICVLTKGRSLDILKRVIKDISQIVYERETSAMDLL